MTRAYIRLDPAFFERKVLTGGYSASEAVALVGSFCLAESQHPRGRFRNARVLRALLGPYAKHVGKLIERGDLVADELGRMYVDGWDEWQEGDVTVKDRMARLRDRRSQRDAADRNSGDGENRNPTVPLRPASPSSGTRRDETHLGRVTLEEVTKDLPPVLDGVSDDESRVFAFIARFGASIRPDQGFGRRLLGLIERRGVEEVLRAAGPMAKANGAMSDRQWVFGLEDVLESPPSAKDARAGNIAVEAQKNSERIFQRMTARRIEHYRATEEWPEEWGPMPQDLQNGAA